MPSLCQGQSKCCVPPYAWHYDAPHHGIRRRTSLLLSRWFQKCQGCSSKCSRHFQLPPGLGSGQECLVCTLLWFGLFFLGCNKHIHQAAGTPVRFSSWEVAGGAWAHWCSLDEIIWAMGACSQGTPACFQSREVDRGARVCCRGLDNSL